MPTTVWLGTKVQPFPVIRRRIVFPSEIKSFERSYSFGDLVPTGTLVAGRIIGLSVGVAHDKAARCMRLLAA